jgi:hypothetical protein
MLTPISVSIVPVKHQVTLKQTSGTPKEVAQRYRLKELLS